MLSFEYMSPILGYLLGYIYFLKNISEKKKLKTKLKVLIKNITKIYLLTIMAHLWWNQW